MEQLNRFCLEPFTLKLVCSPRIEARLLPSLASFLLARALMVTIHNCKCGLKWQIETHDSEGSYRGRLECGICKRLIASWEGPFYYTVKRAAGEEEPSKASAASAT
jgi:hypothetical protein